MKIATLTIDEYNNQGNILQRYALCEILKEYTFDGDVVSIDVQTGKCSDIFAVVLTSTGKVYKVEDNKNLLEEDPFYEISNGNRIKDITLYDSEDLCNNIIYALDENNKIINLK